MSFFSANCESIVREPGLLILLVHPANLRSCPPSCSEIYFLKCNISFKDPLVKLERFLFSIKIIFCLLDQLKSLEISFCWSTISVEKCNFKVKTLVKMTKKYTFFFAMA